MRSAGLLTAALVLLLLGISILTPAGFRSTRRFTCLKCRAERWDRCILGRHSFTTNATVYTPWYDAHFPAHQHLWSAGSIAGYNIFGRQVSCGYCPPHPVASLIPPALQKQFAESSSASNLALFYDWILSTNRDLHLMAVHMVYQHVGTN
jgi:hypothetical protein